MRTHTDIHCNITTVCSIAQCDSVYSHTPEQTDVHPPRWWSPLCAVLWTLIWHRRVHFRPRRSRRRGVLCSERSMWLTAPRWTTSTIRSWPPSKDRLGLQLLLVALLFVGLLVSETFMARLLVILFLFFYLWALILGDASHQVFN